MLPRMIALVLNLPFMVSENGATRAIYQESNITSARKVTINRVMYSDY